MSVPSVLWRCWLGDRKGMGPVKTEWWDAGVVVCLGWGADLHMAQLIPLSPTASCSRKSRLVLVLSFWYWLTRVVPVKIRSHKMAVVVVRSERLAHIISQASAVIYVLWHCLNVSDVYMLISFCSLLSNFCLLIIPSPTWSSGRRYSVLQQKFLSFFFSFAKGFSRWLYRQGTFLAQKVGYRCDLIKLVRNLGADSLPPLKFVVPKTPISVNFRTISDFAGPLHQNGTRYHQSKNGLLIYGHSRTRQ